MEGQLSKGLFLHVANLGGTLRASPNALADAQSQHKHGQVTPHVDLPSDKCSCSTLSSCRRIAFAFEMLEDTVKRRGGSATKSTKMKF